MAKDRETRLPEDQLGIPEDWDINGDPIHVRADDPDSLQEALQAAAYILRFIGGVVTLAPVRRELAPDVFATTEYVFRWNSFVPPVREKPPTEDPLAHEPIQEPEPALAD